MDKDVLKKIIVENQERIPFVLFERKINLHLSSDQIVALIGVRRAGKTHVLYQIINALCKQGVSKKQILLLNFEDERLNLTQEILQLILDAYYELYPEETSKKTYLFFDEIQVVNGWEKFIRRLQETKQYKIYITGSSSKLLSKEIATTLRGRSISEYVYPLSFNEYLEYKGIILTKQTEFSKQRYSVINLFDAYLRWGGFFEVVNAPDDAERRKILESYTDLIIYKDLIERYKIKNLSLLKYLIQYFVTNTSQKTSLNSVYDSVKNKMPVSKSAISNYVSMLCDASALIEVKKYDSSLKKQNTPSKYYVVDTGFKTAIGHNISEDFGKMLETLVLLELKREEKGVFFSEEGGECDFVIKDNTKIVEAIQVTASIEEHNRGRELKGLIEAMQKYKLKQAIVITKDQNATFTIDGAKIVAKPFWQWVLDRKK